MFIHNLFPTPVGFFDYTRNFNKTEKNFFINQKQRPNMGNTTSENFYILNDKKMTNIRTFIEKCVGEYFSSVYDPVNDVKLRITQSWLNYTKPKEFHHKHEHPNSFISGVFYLQTNSEKDKIFFYKNQYKQLALPYKNWNEWNTDSWWYEAIQGRLILFPSHLTHMVETVESEETRISLSFNTFLTGYVGEENQLTALHLTD